MLFGTKINSDVSVPPKDDDEDCQIIEQKDDQVEEIPNEGIIILISHLIIQYHDKEFNPHSQIIRQVLTLFFKNYILFSQQRCEIMF